MPREVHNGASLFEIGLFNTTNCHLYHYAGNNPVRYVDPDGKQVTGTLVLKPVEKGVAKTAAKTAAKLGLCAIDGPFPIGDIIAGIWTLYDIYQFTKDMDSSDIQTKINSEADTGNNPLITLYRAVDEKELNSIKDSYGKFKMGDNSTYEYGKLFQTNINDAYKFLEDANSMIAVNDPYIAVVATSAPKGSFFSVDTIIDAPSAVIVPPENLPLLSPAIILP
ncbi:MAG: hypothetical protein IJR93_10810 [Treponema sp.]|nr:hypothetical protein [Treponema sp.]